MTSPEEIWATRLQREILALTDKAEDTHSIGVLPPFVSLHDHTLDINEGQCFVEFAITVELATSTSVSNSSDNSEVKKKVEGAIGESVEDYESENIGNATVGDNISDDTEHTSNKSSTGQSFNVQVVISLDASLKKRNSTFHATSSYPFYKPLVKIVSGAEHFDSSLNIVNGDRIYVDLEWTPSLHMNDAVQNVAVKIRESLKKKENYLTIVKPENARAFNDEVGFEHDLLDEVKADLNKAGAKVSSFFSDLRNRATAVADELDQAVGAGTYEAGSVEPSEQRSVSSEPKRKFKIPRKPKSPTKMKVVTAENIEIGDEIDLSCEPWNSAVGLYQCKPLRRPEFITAAMISNDQTPEKVRTMNKVDDGEDGIDGDLAHVYGQRQQCTPNNYLMLHAGGIREVTGAGLAGASSMFRSFTKSAKSLVEESFLMLTEELVIELKCNKFSVATATVSWTIPVSHLAKLKFRRQESISLFFKEAPEDPIIYMCENSAEAVKQIQNVLKRHGVKGKHTNATMAKTIQSAIQMVEDIRVMEQNLEENPSAEKVTIIMDLYRQAAERFELAGDARHEECVARLREFVASPIVAAILESSKEEDERQMMESEDVVSPVLDSDSKETAVQGESEVESTTADETEDGGDAVDEDLMKAMEDAENMINSAHDDLTELSIDDFDDDDDVNSSAVVASSSSAEANNGINMISEFEDMLKDADKELEELMNS